jgi:hypothetical protein
MSSVPVADSTIASISIKTRLDLSGIKTDLASLSALTDKQNLKIKAKLDLTDFRSQIADIQKTADAKKIKIQAELDVAKIKAQIDKIEDLFKKLNGYGQSAGLPRGGGRGASSPTADIEAQRIALQKLQAESLKAEAALAKSKGLDNSGLLRTQALLQEIIKSKQAIARVEKLGLDASTLAKAKADIDRTLRANTEKINLRFNTEQAKNCLLYTSDAADE